MQQLRIKCAGPFLTDSKQRSGLYSDHKIRFIFQCPVLGQTRILQKLSGTIEKVKQGYVSVY